jgi:endonuclease/exonuclease/phosphatase family metal-dependent hydrolase
MLLTRLPVMQVLRHTLPWPARETNNMTRGLIEATVMTAAGPFRLMTTHLEYSHPDIRAAQIEAIRDIHSSACDRAATPRNDGLGTYRMTAGAASAILAGDFNVKPADPLLARLAESFPQTHPSLRDAWTIANGATPHPLTACIVDQSFAQPHCCDYIFVTEDLAPRIRRVVCDEHTRVSDHQPILLEFA